MNFVDRLNGCADFACVFDLVKSAVESTTGRRRVGLILGLSNLPNHVGAFHQLGSNFIIMNKRLLKAVIGSGNNELINAYVFHILLHEYIHSLGYVNEQETQILTHAISEKVLGAEHTATQIARHGIGFILSKLDRMGDYGSGSSSSRGIEIVKDFESDNLNYFG